MFMKLKFSRWNKNNFIPIHFFFFFIILLYINKNKWKKQNHPRQGAILTCRVDDSPLVPPQYPKDIGDSQN